MNEKYYVLKTDDGFEDMLEKLGEKVHCFSTVYYPEYNPPGIMSALKDLDIKEKEIFSISFSGMVGNVLLDRYTNDDRQDILNCVKSINDMMYLIEIDMVHTVLIDKTSSQVDMEEMLSFCNDYFDEYRVLPMEDTKDFVKTVSRDNPFPFEKCFTIKNDRTHSNTNSVYYNGNIVMENVSPNELTEYFANLLDKTYSKEKKDQNTTELQMELD